MTNRSRRARRQPRRSSRVVARGERVFLRRPTTADRDELIELWRANRGFLRPWEPRMPGGGRSPQASAFERLLRFARSPRYRKFLVCLNDNGQIIGGVNLNGISPAPFLSSTMGYWIGKDFARNGYTTEALNLLVEHAFTALRLHRVEANIMPNNTASLALIRKCRFRFEGLAKRYLQINGRWSDHERWAMTVEEWNGREGRRKGQSNVIPRARIGRSPKFAAIRRVEPS